MASADIAHATLTISTEATSKVTCSANVCSATAKNAVLNVTQLQTLLASSPVTIKSGATAGSIVVNAALGWASSNSLTLDSYQSITVDKTISVNGTGGLTLTLSDGSAGGTLSFGPRGNVTFLGLSNSVTINGAAYTLVPDISTLAADIAANASGKYALANNYNAKPDGKYKSSPVATTFTGTFEGFGNTITGLAIKDTAKSATVGLFAVVGAVGIVRDVGIVAGNVTGGSDSNGSTGISVGELVGTLSGSVVNCYSAGVSTVGTNTSTANAGIVATAGGLVGAILSSTGLVANSYSTSTVTGGGSAYVGGLVGGIFSGGTVQSSHASGKITTGSNTQGGTYSGAYAGGLVGIIYDNSNAAVTMTNDYATGSATAGSDSYAGGLVGGAGGPATIRLSYATGAVSVGPGVSLSSFAFGGGLVGYSYLVNNLGNTIDQSFATGTVAGAPDAFVGGLVGYTLGAVTNSYATGAVSATGAGFTGLGGLAGDIDTGGTIGTSYSTGTVQLVGGSYDGGFVGDLVGAVTKNYWDTTTSGIATGTGNMGNHASITGRTTAQLQAGLPAGFSSTIWGVTATINGGFPYLLANPPPA